MVLVREVTLGDKQIKLEFQKYAKQANGSVMVSSGGTQVLVTACAENKSGQDLGFFPLGVDYIEKAYASGRVPGGYLKREGRPSDAAALKARMIDRPIRPCFSKNYKSETVITATVVSYEHGCSPVPLAMLGASSALMISEIPFLGPIAGIRLGKKDGEYIIDPIEGDQDSLDLDLTIACKRDAILMVEAGAKFIPEEEMIDAMAYAHELMEPLFTLQEEIQKEIGKEKWIVEETPTDPALAQEVNDALLGPLTDALTVADKHARSEALSALEKQVGTQLNADGDADRGKAVGKAVHELKSTTMRNMILKDSKRIDGRGLRDVRPISSEVAVLQNCHGSSLFTRGETQSLCAITLAAADGQQRSEALWSEDLKDRFMLHYNFPPFCVGEARMQRPPGRREIGHGTLAKRALTPVVPNEQDFGYTIRMVSEILESNGSSSMATVCSGTMALLDAGVPLTDSVAGIAMGMIKEGDEYAIISDILGDEDHLGDMDFKVCGSAKGLTALQMDNKVGGITKEILQEALSQAKEGRMHILGKMAEVITEPRNISQSAPRIFKIKIASDRIRDLIGPAGKTIRKITAETGAKIDVDDTGMITLMAPDINGAQAAKTLIRAYTSAPRVGEIYLGKVARIMEFGAFLEIKPGLEGLCHISQLDNDHVERVEDVIKSRQDELLVKIVDVDKQGRVKLSRKEALGQKPTYERGLV